MGQVETEDFRNKEVGLRSSNEDEETEAKVGGAAIQGFAEKKHGKIL